MTAVTVSWINVSFTTPRIFNLEKDFRIATSSGENNRVGIIINFIHVGSFFLFIERNVIE